MVYTTPRARHEYALEFQQLNALHLAVSLFSLVSCVGRGVIGADIFILVTVERMRSEETCNGDSELMCIVLRAVA
jgi:hypothetical protein